MKDIIKKNFILDLAKPKTQEELEDETMEIDIKSALYSKVSRKYDSIRGKLKEKKINDIFENNGWQKCDVDVEYKPDVFFAKNNMVIVGEIKNKDNHDSSTIRSNVKRLKTFNMKCKEYFLDKIIIPCLMFICDTKKPHEKFYRSHNDDFEVYYGEDIFFMFENKTELYQSLNINEKISFDDILNYDDYDVNNFTNNEAKKILQNIPNEQKMILSPNGSFFKKLEQKYIQKNKEQLILQFTYD